MGAAEIARAEKERREAEDRRRREAEKREMEEQDARRRVLEDHVRQSLSAFVPLGLTLQGNTLRLRDGREVGRAWVDWHHWEFAASDESVPEERSGVVIWWSVRGQHPNGVPSHSTEDFDRRFGEAMARWI